jgi:hypothetical protein
VSVPVVVSVCGDAGGALALIPVLKQLSREPGVRLESFAYRQGLELLGQHGFMPRAIPAEADAAWVAAQLAERDARLVLAATSQNGEDHEKRFIEAAARRGIPSVAVLDFWANYRARFSDATGRLCFVPDKIAAMDEAAQRGLLAAGIADGTIVVTGQPAFDELVEQRTAFTSGDRARLRALHGMTEGSLLVLFASQPLRDLYGSPQSPAYLGYDERSVLDSLVPAIDGAARRVGKAITLVIRPHPREPLEPYRAYTARDARVVVSRDGEARVMAMAADLVVGMTSMLLVEAHFLACNVVSVQPERRGANPLPSSVTDEIVVIERTIDIDAALHASLARARHAPSSGPSVGAPAAPRVVSLVRSLLRAR